MKTQVESSQKLCMEPRVLIVFCCFDSYRGSSSCTSLSLFCLNLIDAQLNPYRAVRNRSANKLLALQCLEECWLTGTQLKGDWFIELECSGPPNLSISLPKVDQPERPIKENHIKEVLSCTRPWMRSWSPAEKGELNKKQAVVTKTANLGSRWEMG